MTFAELLFIPLIDLYPMLHTAAGVCQDQIVNTDPTHRFCGNGQLIGEVVCNAVFFIFVRKMNKVFKAEKPSTLGLK